MIPQIIYLGLLLFNLLYSAHMHGKQKTGKYDFFTSFLGVCIVLCILYFGGFFNVFIK